MLQDFSGPSHSALLYVFAPLDLVIEHGDKKVIQFTSFKGIKVFAPADEASYSRFSH